MRNNGLLKPIAKYTSLIFAAAVVFMLGTKIKKIVHNKPPKTPTTQQTKDITNNVLVNLDYLKEKLAIADELVKNNAGAKAIEYLKTLLQYERTFGTIHFHIAKIYLDSKQHNQAEHHLKKVIELTPQDVNAHTFLGTALRDQGKFEQATDHFKTAIRFAPTYFDAHLHLGKTYHEMGKHDKAVRSYHEAIKIDPKSIFPYLNMAYTYNKIGQLEKAIDLYKHVIKIDPDCQNAHYNLGYSLKIMGKLQDALKSLDKAIELKPDYLDAHIARAQSRIALRMFDDGWDEYEWRWGLFGIDPHKYREEMWDGSDITGKTILLRTEQGLGDTMQFIRLAKQVKKMGAKKVICKVQKPLVKLLSNCDFIDEVIHDVKKAGAYDCYTHLMSLPRIFKMQPDQIPAEIPYFKADPTLEKEWAAKLSKNKNFKVGLCWHVDPIHEKTKSPWSLRSIDLEQLKPLANLKNVTFYSLQKLDNYSALATAPAGLKIENFGPDFDKKHGSFMDSAAIIKSLDLVITVDTCLAHLAGALGKPVWMFLPYAPDCRWYLDTDKTPWYPTMTLFRQTKPQSWDGAINNVALSLEQEIKKNVIS